MALECVNFNAVAAHLPKYIRTHLVPSGEDVTFSPSLLFSSSSSSNGTSNICDSGVDKNRDNELDSEPSTEDRSFLSKYTSGFRRHLEDFLETVVVGPAMGARSGVNYVKCLQATCRYMSSKGAVDLDELSSSGDRLLPALLQQLCGLMEVFDSDDDEGGGRGRKGDSAVEMQGATNEALPSSRKRRLAFIDVDVSVGGRVGLPCPKISVAPESTNTLFEAIDHILSFLGSPARVDGPLSAKKRRPHRTKEGETLFSYENSVLLEAISTVQRVSGLSVTMLDHLSARIEDVAHALSVGLETNNGKEEEGKERKEAMSALDELLRPYWKLLACHLFASPRNGLQLTEGCTRSRQCVLYYWVERSAASDLQTVLLYQLTSSGSVDMSPGKAVEDC